MFKPETLQLLISLANKEQEKNTQNLGKSLIQKNKAIKTMDDLIQYQKEYTLTFHKKSSNGLSKLEYQNYHLFLSNIEIAINKQKEILHTSTLNTEKDKIVWNHNFKKIKGFEHIEKIQDKKKQIKENKLEQKLMDEFALKNYLKKI